MRHSQLLRAHFLRTCCATIALSPIVEIAAIDRVNAQEMQANPTVHSIILSPTNGQSVICFPNDRGGYCISIFPYAQSQGDSLPPQIEIRTPAITHSEEPPEIYVNVVLPTPTKATPMTPAMTPAMTPPIAPTSVPAIEPIIPAATSTDSSVSSDRVGDPNLEPLW